MSGRLRATANGTSRESQTQSNADASNERADSKLIRRELQRILVQLPAAVCITEGPDHIIESANSRYMQLAGRRDLIGKTAREAFPEIAGQGFFELLDHVYATGEPHVGTEVRVVWDRSGDGTRAEGFVNHVYQPLRDATDQVYGIIIHVVDVTELVRSRHIAERHAKELTRMTHSLARVNHELDQFAYVASHDLKAPLRGIASLAQWIQDDLGDKLGEDSRKHLGLLQARVHRMGGLIDGLLQYARIGRVRSKVEKVQVRELLSEVVEMIAASQDASIDIGPDMPTLETERLALQQVFLNLVGNAIKHSGRRDTKVAVAVCDSGDFYKFTVSDNGPGIPQRFHAKIWDIFETLQARDKVEGAGMGLALVKKNVESRGGKAWVESRPETEGAKFHFLWPKHMKQEDRDV